MLKPAATAVISCRADLIHLAGLARHLRETTNCKSKNQLVRKIVETLYEDKLKQGLTPFSTYTDALEYWKSLGYKNPAPKGQGKKALLRALAEEKPVSGKAQEIKQAEVDAVFT